MVIGEIRFIVWYIKIGTLHITIIVGIAKTEMRKKQNSKKKKKVIEEIRLILTRCYRRVYQGFVSWTVKLEWIWIVAHTQGSEIKLHWRRLKYELFFFEIQFCSGNVIHLKRDHSRLCYEGQKGKRWETHPQVRVAVSPLSPFLPSLLWRHDAGLWRQEYDVTQVAWQGMEIVNERLGNYIQ